MAYTTNIAMFLPPSGAASNQANQAKQLLDAYRILVAIELALKDAGFTGGHHIPEMLSKIPAKHPSLSFTKFQNDLRRDLTKIMCNDRDSKPPRRVKESSYPEIRYTRFSGDWGGVHETSFESINSLFQTTHNLLSYLRQHKNVLGITI